MQQIAHFPTARGPQLLATMSKHFAHKIEVETKGKNSRFHFEMGLAVIEALSDGLRLIVDGAGENDLQRLREVIESHLLRFAQREDPQPLSWNEHQT